MKPRIIFPHLLDLSRLCAADYLKVRHPVDGLLAEIYFKAAYGLSEISLYEQMARGEVFDDY